MVIPLNERRRGTAAKKRQTSGVETRTAYPVKCLPQIIPKLAAERAIKHGLPLNRYLESLVLQDAGKPHSVIAKVFNGGKPHEPAAAVYDEAAPIARAGAFLSEALAALDAADPAEAKRLILLARRECLVQFKTVQRPLVEAQRVRSQLRFEERGGEGNVAREYLSHEDYDHVPEDAD